MSELPVIEIPLDAGEAERQAAIEQWCRSRHVERLPAPSPPINVLELRRARLGGPVRPSGRSR